MNLRNLTPFLMLDHFHVKEGAVRPILLTMCRRGPMGRRAFLITHTEDKRLSLICWKGALAMLSCCVDYPNQRQISEQATMKTLQVTKAPFVICSTFEVFTQFPHLVLRVTVTGGVQWMCAGKGIIHAEMPVHAKGQPDPRGLQLWVDLPKKVDGIFLF